MSSGGPAVQQSSWKGAAAEAIKTSSTIRVEGLSKLTRDHQIHELFSSVGPVVSVIMGISREDRTPCGFCFVEYASRSSAESAMLYLKTARLDGIEIKSAWDSGFQEGRQFGRRPNNRGLGGAAAAPLGADGKRPAKRFKREQKNDDEWKKLGLFGSGDMELRRINRHLRQKRTEVMSRGWATLPRILKKEAERKVYDKKLVPRPATTVYWSERQYLILFLEFMLKHGHRSKRVICTGAGPGREVPFIAGLFPEHVFELYEEKIPFQVDHVPGKIELHSGHDGALTEEKARALGKAGARPLFIYNASPIPGVAQMDQNIERKAAEELAKQTQIHTAMKPVASLLEFSLPWKKGSTSAPVGEIWLPIWGKSTGTVGRLVSTSTEVVQYDHTKFEEQMFFFNTMTRANAFKHDADCSKVHGMDHCYDCAAEAMVVRDFLVAHKGADMNSPKTIDLVTDMMLQIAHTVAPKGGKSL